MPSFFKRAKGVQKPHIVAHKPHGFFNLNLNMNLNCNLNYLAPVVPFSSVFESSDCIWYYGTLYVKEAVAVSKMACVANTNNEANTSAVANTIVVVNANASASDANASDANASDANINEDDDAESVCSSTSTSIHSGNPNKSTRSIAKTNQIRYIHDGTRLRHLVEWNGNEWHATFDAETNRVIRTPDGVAFDTLRQFARVHCNEVLGTTTALNNVWSDPQFQYQGDDGQWHPLSVLRTI
jgi:hypothetical protein